MSKNILVRIHSNSNDGIFDAKFNDEIIINQNSSIALQSCSLSRAMEFLNINATNDSLQFQISAAQGLIKVDLAHGTYTRSTILAFLATLQDAMNSKLSVSDTKNFGTQINIHIDADEKVNYTFGYAGLTSWARVNPNIQTQNITVASNQIRNSGAANASLNNAFAFGLIPFTKGCGVLRCRIDNYVSDSVNGFTIGLIDAVHIDKLKNNQIADSDIKIGIRTLNDTTDQYQTVIDGVATNNGLGLTPLKFVTATKLLNDIVEIQLDGGNFDLMVHQDGASAQLHSEPYDHTKEYYAFISINGASNKIRLGRVGHTHDPFAPVPANYIESESADLADTEVETVSAPTPPTHNGRPTAYNILFPSLEVSQYFGFLAVNQNITGATTATGEFIADATFDNVVSSDTYLLELLNLPLASYDSLSGGRKNILSSIPISERIISNTGIIQYEPAEKNFIALNNRNQLSLRNIRARITTDSFDPISTEGLSTVTVIIKSPE